MDNVKLVSINTKIATIAGAEKITKKVLGELSREMLDYIVTDESWDSDAINRLLAVLTPMNKRIAIIYFSHFTPFIVDEHGVFGGMPKSKKDKAKRKLECSKAVTEFLVNEDANIWSWAEEHVKIEAKDVDWAKRVTSAITSAMSDDKGGLGLPEVMGAVLAAGLSAADITAALAILYQEEAEAEHVEVQEAA